MFSLLKFPDELIVSCMTDGSLCCADLQKLDTAFCNKNERILFLKLLSSAWFVLAATPKRSAFKWIEKRCVKVESAVFQYQDFEIHIGFKYQFNFSKLE